MLHDDWFFFVSPRSIIACSSACLSDDTCGLTAYDPKSGKCLVGGTLLIAGREPVAEEGVILLSKVPIPERTGMLEINTLMAYQLLCFWFFFQSVQCVLAVVYCGMWQVHATSPGIRTKRTRPMPAKSATEPAMDMSRASNPSQNITTQWVWCIW